MSDLRRAISIFGIGVLLSGAAAMAQGQARGPLRVHPRNPRYFTDGSAPSSGPGAQAGSFKAIYLTGSHTWNNFKDMGKTDPPPRFDFDAYLDFLVENHHNFVRLWTWELTRYSYDGKVSHAEPFPWPRAGPGEALDGKPRFDLEKLEQPYFDRLRARVEAAGRRGIYVSVMLFEGHGISSSDVPWCWKGHPFNAQNNSNGIDGDPDRDGRGIEAQSLEIPAITKIQEAYARKVVDALNDLDNVLYEIANESGNYSTRWQYHMIRFIKECEAGKPKQHPVGMTFQWAGGKERGTNEALFESPADWISPSPDGGYRENPPAADGRKVILSDTDHLWGIGGNPGWVWKSFARGLNPLFMDPYKEAEKGDEPKKEKSKKPTTWTDHLSGKPALDPKWDALRKNLGYARRFAERMDLAAATPQDGLASTGYCLAKPGAEYLVYIPDGGEATVDLTTASGKVTAEWFDPRTGASRSGGTAEGGAKRSFKAPEKGDWVLYLSAGAGTAKTGGPAGGPGTRPSFLFLLSDDQRADTISAHGNPHIRTPNLDRLAAEGFSFRGNYCFGGNSGAVCVPSRAMIQSGRVWLRITNDLKGVKILPELLRERGYVTFATGKWHNQEASFLRGFERAKAVFFGGMSDHTKVPLKDLSPDGKLGNARVGEKFSSEIFADAAVEFLESHRGDRPFFAYVAFTAPHDPRMPPEEYRRYDHPPPLPDNFLPQHPFDNGHMKGGRDEDLAPWPRAPEIIRDQLAEYYGMIEHLDGQIGRILSALRKTGHDRDTVVVFASDQGLALGSHGLLGKQSLYEHSMRAPLIIGGPGIPRGKSTSAFTYLHDLYPTICGLAAIEPPPGLDGKNLAPLWEGRAAKIRDSVFLAFLEVQRAVRDERWKLIAYPKIGHLQLFDLEEDPHEKRNLIDDPRHSEKLKELLALLRRWQAETQDRVQVPEVNAPPEKVDLTGRARTPDQWQPDWIRKKYFGQERD